METSYGLESNLKKNIDIRPIEPGDNEKIAAIIRKSLEEFGANKPGTVYYDDSTDHLFETFNNEKGAAYYIATFDGEVVGGAGIFPTSNLPAGIVELVKMYVSKKARQHGIGKLLMQKALNIAKQKGYTHAYIETMPELSTAIKFYEKIGFEYLPTSLGNSGHTDCTVWMLKTL